MAGQRCPWPPVHPQMQKVPSFQSLPFATCSINMSSTGARAFFAHVICVQPGLPPGSWLTPSASSTGQGPGEHKALMSWSSGLHFP